MDQWRTLRKALREADVDVITMDQVEGLPDMVFCCNSGIVLGNQVTVLAYFTKIGNNYILKMSSKI